MFLYLPDLSLSRCLIGRSTCRRQDILNDRGMMGDGVIDISRLRAAVEAQGFAGYFEIEIFSNGWWGKSMDKVLRTCIERHRSVV